jgi:SAM-dependent methyltransferase
MSTTAEQTPDRALKDRHRAMWASGDYPAVARELIPALGEVLVAATGLGPGQRVLDVAAGSGNASIPAAQAGATVVASDLTPELLAAGRADAEARGLELAWEVADAESLPYGEAEFDAVISCVGVMFAPRHEVAAAELLRVCRPGGRIGLLSWTPQGVVGQMLGAMRPFLPPPPAGARPPVLWGEEQHVRALLGDGVDDLVLERRELPVALFPGPTDMRSFFARTYGPTISACRNAAGDPDRTAALDDALDEVAARFRDRDGSMGWEYLLVTARRR